MPKQEIILKGILASAGIVKGKARIILDPFEIPR